MKKSLNFMYFLFTFGTFIMCDDITAFFDKSYGYYIVFLNMVFSILIYKIVIKNKDKFGPKIKIYFGVVMVIMAVIYIRMQAVHLEFLLKYSINQYLFICLILSFIFYLLNYSFKTNMRAGIILGGILAGYLVIVALFQLGEIKLNYSIDDKIDFSIFKIWYKSFFVSLAFLPIIIMNNEYEWKIEKSIVLTHLLTMLIYFLVTDKLGIPFISVTKKKFFTSVSATKIFNGGFNIAWPILLSNMIYIIYNITIIIKSIEKNRVNRFLSFGILIVFIIFSFIFNNGFKFIEKNIMTIFYILVLIPIIILEVKTLFDKKKAKRTL